jgi:hypothetical protein
MALGNYTKFLAKQITACKFGGTAWSEANLSSGTTTLAVSFAANNPTVIMDLVGATDAVNPTASGAFLKDLTSSGNEVASTLEPLLGSDSTGAQNTEMSDEAASLQVFEGTMVYRNPKPLTLFSLKTKCCLVQHDNAESTTTGALTMAFNNIRVNHVGSLTRNASGLLEHKIKFSLRGGDTSGSGVTVTQTSPAVTAYRVRAGVDYAEEIRTA